MELGRLYRDIVETSPDGIWVIDPEGRTIYANPQVARLLGRSLDEVAAMTVFDALDASGRDQFADHLRELHDGEVHPDDVECLWVRPDGSPVWVLVRESPMYDERGAVQGYLHRVTDYSERRRLFEDLSESQEMLAEAQRIARVGSYEWDLVHDRIVASEELHTLYGVPAEEFGGSYAEFLRLIHPDDRHVVDEAVAAAVAGADEFDFVVRVAAPGRQAWMRGRGEVFRDPDGSPVRARGTHQDVTDAKQVEQVLEDLVAQNTLMQEMATAANEAGKLIEVLAVGQELLLRHDDWVRARGYLPRPGEPDGLMHLFLDEEERLDDEGRPGLTAFERGLAVRAHRDRAQFWDEDTHPGRPSIAFPVMVADEVAAVIVITASTPFERHAMIRAMIDQVAVQLGRVAERDRAARELAAARDAAMEASRQKSDFLATMSHEIRTPLNGVIGLNDLLLRTELNAHQQRLASGAQVASRALLAVINDILDFSKIEAGKLELEDIDFEVRAVFDQVASVLAESARSKGLELLVSCHPDVPELLRGDPTRLAQVLTNLGSNAVKFTEQGEVFIRATAEAAADGTVLRVEVVDTGIGVDPAKREHIFDPFSQADASTTRQFGGTGLGLAIASEIVASMGGEIGLESTHGAGARFWFTGRFGRAGTRPRSGAPSEEELGAALSGRRVLVVDDNAHNRLILSEHLGRWVVRATTAPGALRALELLEAAVDSADPFDVVLLDLAMPEHDGLHLAAMVQADERLAGTPLVMLTSAARPSQDDLVRAGVVGCLDKPVLAGEVLRALRAALGEEPGREAAADRRTPEAVGSSEGERPRLLVVEDNPVNQLVALGILETLGYAADTADDGVLALDLWRGGDYDGVLMDVQMPRMDGYATTRAIRELESGGRRTPVLAMTAAAVEGEREKCLAAGMDDFLTKPVDPDLLAAMLRRWVRGDGAGTSEPEVPGTVGVLDLDRLDMLRDLDPGNTAYLDRAVANFVDRSDVSLQDLRDVVAAGDASGLTQVAHRLKGSALNLGLPAVGNLAHELEMLGDAGATTGAESLLETLEEALSQAVTAVLGYRRS